jgi:hypothetical protein
MKKVMLFFAAAVIAFGVNAQGEKKETKPAAKATDKKEAPKAADKKDAKPAAAPKAAEKKDAKAPATK